MLEPGELGVYKRLGSLQSERNQHTLQTCRKLSTNRLIINLLSSLKRKQNKKQAEQQQKEGEHRVKNQFNCTINLANLSTPLTYQLLETPLRHPCSII